MNEVKINTDIIKLDSFLKWCGAVSIGSEAKAAIQNGQVKLNGQTILLRGKKLKKGDKIEFNEQTYIIV